LRRFYGAQWLFLAARQDRPCSCYAGRAPARDNSRGTGAAPLAFVKSPNSAASKSAAHRRPRERSCMSFETPVTATLPLIAHRLLLFRWRTERPAHHARLRSLRQFDNYRTTVPNRSSERGGKGFRFSPSEAGADAELLYLRFNQPLGRLHKALLHFTNADSQGAGVVKHFIPSRGYYEWKNEARGKHPYYFALTANRNTGIWMLCRFRGADLRFCREWQAKKAKRKPEPISCVRGRES
jgi:hypothetical protein